MNNGDECGWRRCVQIKNVDQFSVFKNNEEDVDQFLVFKNIFLGDNIYWFY